MSGFGKFTYKDGETYEVISKFQGEFFNNKKDGKGIIKFSNGTIYYEVKYLKRDTLRITKRVVKELFIIKKQKFIKSNNIFQG